MPAMIRHATLCASLIGLLSLFLTAPAGLAPDQSLSPDGEDVACLLQLQGSQRAHSSDASRHRSSDGRGVEQMELHAEDDQLRSIMHWSLGEGAVSLLEKTDTKMDITRLVEVATSRISSSRILKALPAVAVVVFFLVYAVFRYAARASEPDPLKTEGAPDDDSIQNAEKAPESGQEEKDEEKKRGISGDASIVQAIGLAMTFMTFSGTIILYNAWLFSPTGGNFPYVVCLTGWHMFLNSCLMSFIRVVRPAMMPAARDMQLPLVQILKAVALPALLMSTTLVLGNKAYLYLSVSFIQMVKGGTPAMVYLISYLAGMEQGTKEMTLVMVVILFSMCLLVRGAVKLSILGLVIHMSAFTFEGCRLVCLRRLVSVHGIKFDPLSGLLYYAPICCALILSVAFATGEIWKVAAIWPQIPIEHLLLNGMLACSLNIASVTLLSKATATTLTVCGTIKDMVVVGISMLMFNETVTLMQIIGVTLLLIAVYVYNQLKEDPTFFRKCLRSCS